MAAMIRIIITPKEATNLYGKMVAKEVQLHRAGRGTLFRSGKKQKGFEKWAHVKHPGWIWFQKCLGGIVVAEIHCRVEGGEANLRDSFVGFVDRHFRDHLATITIEYDR